MARLNLAIWQLLVTPFKPELRDPSIRRACVWILSFHFAAPGSISEWNFSTSFLSLFVYKKKTHRFLSFSRQKKLIPQDFRWVVALKNGAPLCPLNLSMVE